MTLTKIAKLIYDMQNVKKKPLSEKAIFDVLKMLVELEAQYHTSFNSPIESLMDLSVTRMEQDLSSEKRNRNG